MMLGSFGRDGVPYNESVGSFSRDAGGERSDTHERSPAEFAATMDAIEEHRRGLQATIREQRKVIAELRRSQERFLSAAEREDSQAKRALALLTLECESEIETLRRLESLDHGLQKETAALSLLPQTEP